METMPRRPDPGVAAVPDPAQLERKLRRRLGHLDATPFIYRKLLALLRKPYASPRDLGMVISTDPSLAVRVLRMVNSAYYGVTQRVASVTQAVAMLGLNVVRSLSFCLASYDAFFSDLGADRTERWRRSLGTGITARQTARRLGLPDAEELFVAGLLADIGITVLEKFAPQDYEELRRRAHQYASPLEAELAILGTTHADIGAWACEEWKLPELLASSVRDHHRPLQSDCRVGACVVHAAAFLWLRRTHGAHPELCLFQEGTLSELELSALDVNTILEGAGKEYAYVESFVGVALGG